MSFPREFYVGWTDDYSARQRAAGKNKLLPLTARQRKEADKASSRKCSLQWIQASLDAQAERLGRYTGREQGIPVGEE